MAKSRTHDALSPHASPSHVSKRFGVRRVNNVPLYLGGSALALLLVVIILVAMDRAHPAASEVATANDAQGDTSQLVATITGNRTGGVVPAEGSGVPMEMLGAVVPIALPDDLDRPPLPPRLAAQGGIKETNEADPDMKRINQEKMQLFENAVRSKTSVPFSDARPAIPASADRKETMQHLAEAQERIAVSQKDDPNVSFKARLAQLQGKEGGDSNSQRNDLSHFDTKDKTDRWQLDSKVEAPQTPYTLRAGFVIPASLISGINSELPGQIIGQVSQHVYDTATGKYLLIPQGARLVGTYTADVAYGQSRVMVAWQRIVFPDGKTIDIGAMPGADGAGYAGFSDQVNNHYLRLFGSAILMSGITAGATLSQNSNSGSTNGQESASSALSAALGQQLGASTAQMISKNLNISPTLEIRPGFRFNVMCVKDLVLDRPYAAFDY